MDEPRTRILTFQTFVWHPAYYRYADENPERIPHILVDRSPCADPFMDTYATPEDRQPVISGLCRARYLRTFRVGDRFLYIARIHPRVHAQLAKRYPDLAIDPSDTRPYYFGVAALRVVWVWNSHEDAATDFGQRRYVTAPARTPYPPNLAHKSSIDAAVARECCIVHDPNRKAHTPDDSTDEMWRQQIRYYHALQRRYALQVAACEVERANGMEALRLDPGSAPLFTTADWGGLRMTPLWRYIPEATAANLRERIARGRIPIRS